MILDNDRFTSANEGTSDLSSTVTTKDRNNNGRISTSDSSSSDDKATVVGGAVGGVLVGILPLVGLVVFVACTVMLKRSRKGRARTEQSSMSKLKHL